MMFRKVTAMMTSTGNIRSPISLLPQELLDRSIDFLHNDKPSLLNCMLVSHRWVDASQYHLYDTKKILLVKDPNASRVAAFKEYLENTPHVRHLIRTFSIIRATGRRRCLVELIDLLSILKNLPRLESLFLDGVELTTARRSAYVAMATPLFGTFRLRILAFNDVAGRQTKETIHGAFMLDFLGLFSEIQTLKLVSSYSRSVWTEMADSPSLTRLQKKTRVSHLQTWLMCRFAVGPTVLPKAINVNSIKYYSLKVLYPQQLQNLGAFLRNPNLDITYLDIDITDYINWGSHTVISESWSALTSCPSIRYFVVHWKEVGEDVGPSDAEQSTALRSLLSGFAPSSLTSLTFCRHGQPPTERTEGAPKYKGDRSGPLARQSDTLKNLSVQFYQRRNARVASRNRVTRETHLLVQEWLGSLGWLSGFEMRLAESCSRDVQDGLRMYNRRANVPRV